MPVQECTQLCLGQNCQAVDTGIGDNAIWDVLKSKKALAHHRALAVTTNYGTRLSMGCQYGLCSRSLTSAGRNLETPSAAPLLNFRFQFEERSKDKF